MSLSKKRKSLLKKKRAPEDVSLQITSMADVFVILLVFLLKNFSAVTPLFTPDSALQLPEVSSSKPVTSSMALEIMKNSIKLDHQTISTLSDFKAPPQDTSVDGSLSPLKKALLSIRPELRKSMPLLILADRYAPVATIRKVLLTASLSGIETYKLVVAEDH
jgi:biopolymer transport protein ExbD